MDEVQDASNRPALVKRGLRFESVVVCKESGSRLGLNLTIGSLRSQLRFDFPGSSVRAFQGAADFEFTKGFAGKRRGRLVSPSWTFLIRFGRATVSSSRW